MQKFQLMVNTFIHLIHIIIKMINFTAYVLIGTYAVFFYDK